MAYEEVPQHVLDMFPGISKKELADSNMPIPCNKCGNNYGSHTGNYTSGMVCPKDKPVQPGYPVLPEEVKSVHGELVSVLSQAIDKGCFQPSHECFAGKKEFISSNGLCGGSIVGYFRNPTTSNPKREYWLCKKHWDLYNSKAFGEYSHLTFYPTSTLAEVLDEDFGAAKDPHCRGQFPGGLAACKSVPCTEFLVAKLKNKTEYDCLCEAHKAVYQEDNETYWEMTSITPIPNPDYKPIESHICNIFGDTHLESSWGLCGTKFATHKLQKIGNGKVLFGTVYTCDTHAHIWKDAGWTEIPMEGTGEVPEDLQWNGSKHDNPAKFKELVLYKFGTESPWGDGGFPPICRVCGWGWNQHYNTRCEQETKPGFPLSGQSMSYPVAKAGRVVRDKIATGKTVRTQKARGITTLKDASFPVPGFKVYDVNGCDPKTLVGKFVRPCPMRPRHGFVDSRSIKTAEDAELIIKQTLEADPEAEFLMMDYVDAPYSGIWTPGYLAIGLGTDGATAGKTAVTVPVLGDYLSTRDSYTTSPDICKKAGVTNAAYVEILWAKKYESFDALPVQLRDGPKLPEDCTDYIPEKFEVTDIIVVHEGDDLLEWETRMQALKGNSNGTIVHHPGGTMASHYAVHAMLNGVPVAITFEPKIGDVVKPTTKKHEPNINMMRAGFVLACNTKIAMDKAANFMLLGCHSISSWLGKQDLLLGATMGFAWRLSITAALGEERHYNRSRKSTSLSRDQVYKAIWNKTDTAHARERFVETLDLFLNGDKWPGDSYGGFSWFRFTSNALRMYNHLIAKEPAKALEALNQLVHSAHNTGWGFNKFTTQAEMDKTASNPIYSGFKVGPYLHMLLTAEKAALKTAARSFWKRSALVEPIDKGTGQRSEKENEEESNNEEETEHDSGCECSHCAAVRFEHSKNESQTVTYAQAKLVEDHATMTHIQFKSDNSGGKYYTKNVPTPGGLNEVFNKKIGQVVKSLADSTTKYLVLVKGTGGWGLHGIAPNYTFYKLLDEEVIPNG